MNNYVVLARGESVGTAKVVAICADPTIVGLLLRELAGEGEDADEERDHAEQDRQERLTVVRGGADG